MNRGCAEFEVNRSMWDLGSGGMKSGIRALGEKEAPGRNFGCRIGLETGEISF